MSITTSITEADILDEIIAPREGGLSREAAQSILQLHFSESASESIRQLLDANNRDEISPQERGVLDKYLGVGQLLDLLQAKARVSLGAGR